MRHLLVALLCVASAHGYAQGVVFVGDVDSVPASVLELPTMPGSLDGRPATPALPYHPLATAQQEIQLTAAQTEANKQSKSEAQKEKSTSRKSSFFSKMKPTWLFGDDEKSEPPKDPFLAQSASNKEAFRNKVAPIAVYDASQEMGIASPILNAAYSKSKLSQPNPKQPKLSLTKQPTKPASSNVSANSRSYPRHNYGGVAMRKHSQPKGILNHLGWMNGDEESSKQASSKASQLQASKRPKQTKPRTSQSKSGISMPKASDTNVMAKGPSSVISKPNLNPQSKSIKTLSAKNRGVAGFGTSTTTTGKNTSVAKVPKADAEKSSNVLEVIEVKEPKAIAIDQIEAEPIFISDEDFSNDDIVFVESYATETAEPKTPSISKADSLAILDREIVQPALKSPPITKAPKTVEPIAEMPTVESAEMANGEPELPLPAIEPQPYTTSSTPAEPSQVDIPSIAASAQPLPTPYEPEPIASRSEPVANPTQNPFTASRAIVDPNKEPNERSRTLLSEANELAQKAKSLEEFTGIVQRCRYVLAIDDAPIAVNYANELASWALNKRGEKLLDKGRNAEATVDFHDAVHCNPNCWRAIHNLGVLQAQAGDYETAATHFERALVLNPEYAKAYANRAALHVQSAKYQKALEDYQRAIQIDPDLAMAHAGRGRVCHMLGYLEQALRHLDAAQILTPGDATICLGRGDLLVDLGRYGQARQAYLQAIELEPKGANAYRNLAWMQATCPSSSFRNGEEALSNAIRASKLSGTPDDITLDTHAAALASLGRFDEAVVLVKKAIEIAPASDVTAYSERLQMYLRGEAFLSQPFGMVESASFETEPSASSTH